MDKQEIVNKLVQEYRTLTSEASTYKNKEDRDAVLNHRYGIKLAAITLGVYKEFRDLVERAY